MLELSTIQQITVWVIPVLLAITLHEAAHAWVAYRLGDTTAKMLGRLSINPLRHIDLVGTIIVPIVTLMLSQFSFVFGWAKPVPINTLQLRNPRRDIALVTLAGPLSNLMMAILWTALLKMGTLLPPQSSTLALFLLLSARAGVIINLLLAYLNLVPIPPLDGSRVIMSLLSPKNAARYTKLEPFGLLILMLLVFTGVLSWLISPPINGSLMLLRSLFRL